MQTQREKLNTSIPVDLIISFVVFAICCFASFFVEPTVIDSFFSSNP